MGAVPRNTAKIAESKQGTKKRVFGKKHTPKKLPHNANENGKRDGKLGCCNRPNRKLYIAPCGEAKVKRAVVAARNLKPCTPMRKFAPPAKNEKS